MASTEQSTTSGQTTEGVGNTPATGPIRPEHETDKTGVTSAHQPGPTVPDDKPTSSNDTTGAGPEPSVGAEPTSAQQPTSDQQGDRPHDEPNSEEHSRIQETKKEAEEAANVDTSSSPGPKPLEESHKPVAGAAAGGDDDDGPQKESQGEGTGELYEKSTGLKADGGDFDATRPGAAREADREFPYLPRFLRDKRTNAFKGLLAEK